MTHIDNAGNAFICKNLVLNVSVQERNTNRERLYQAPTSIEVDGVKYTLESSSR